MAILGYKDEDDYYHHGMHISFGCELGGCLPVSSNRSVFDNDLTVLNVLFFGQIINKHNRYRDLQEFSFIHSEKIPLNISEAPAFFSDSLTIFRNKLETVMQKRIEEFQAAGNLREYRQAVEDYNNFLEEGFNRIDKAHWLQAQTLIQETLYGHSLGVSEETEWLNQFNRSMFHKSLQKSIHYTIDKAINLENVWRGEFYITQDDSVEAGDYLYASTVPDVISKIQSYASLNLVEEEHEHVIPEFIARCHKEYSQKK